MKILITGDKGFVGTETKKLLTDHEVIGYDLMDGYDNPEDALNADLYSYALKCI